MEWTVPGSWAQVSSTGLANIISDLGGLTS